MARPKSGRLNISILNINVHTITFNGSLNIGKTLMVQKKEQKKNEDQNDYSENT